MLGVAIERSDENFPSHTQETKKFLWTFQSRCGSYKKREKHLRKLFACDNLKRSFLTGLFKVCCGWAIGDMTGEIKAANFFIFYFWII